MMRTTTGLVIREEHRHRRPTAQGPPPSTGNRSPSGRPTDGREAYSPYVERLAEGPNEADGPLSPPSVVEAM